ncbi:MAG: HAMP domain-containing sensor histidine kinase, partial [Treponema sp.]|nr:HAMP domain-containing sensor histidine kinase [Treponema sp.]
QLADGNLSQSCLPTKSDVKKNEITSIQESLEKMRIALIEEQNRKQKFIMGMSHDLRTPIAIIRGYIEAINDGIVSSPDEIEKSLELIHIKSTQLEEMINTLINFMKMDSYEILKDIKEESITQIIKDFAKNSFVMANVFKRKIITNIDLPKDIVIEVNKMLVQRAFENLFSNAIRYTKDNDSIFLNAYILQEKNEIIFEIKDTGIGIKKNDLNYIFDMFYRGTNSRREEGMGIGLSVVKNVINTYGWKINVSSEENKGTTFIIHIPFVEN